MKYSTGCVIARKRCQNRDVVVVLRAVRSFASHLARLKNARMVFFNRLLGHRRRRRDYDPAAAYTVAMSTFVENPVFWIAVTVLLEALLAIALVRTGRGALIAAMIGVLLLGAAGLLLERLVVTEREEVEAAFDDIAAALERDDVAGVLARLAPEAANLRTEASSRMPRVEIDDAKIRDLKVSINRRANPPTARADFKAIVEARDKRGEVPYEHFIRQCSVGLRREGDRWLLTDYTSTDLLDPDARR